MPQAYLRAFAEGTGRQARIWAFDRVDGKAFLTLVRNVASRRDFNRIEADGVDPNALEQAFGHFEGSAAAALERIQYAGSFSVQEDRLLILNLVALLAVRNPRWRRQTGGMLSHAGEQMLRMMVANKERWETTQKRAQPELGGTDDERISYEEARDFVHDPSRYKIVPNQTHQIGLELNVLNMVLKTLAARKWTLLVAGDKAGNFVTSDHPVCLIDISERPSSIYGIGFGTAETAVLFPVSKKLLLSGRFEGNEAVRAIGPVDVARVNAQIIQRADRQVFACDASFAYLTRNGLMKGSQLVSDPFFQPRQAEAGRNPPDGR